MWISKKKKEKEKEKKRGGDWKWINKFKYIVFHNQRRLLCYQTSLYELLLNAFINMQCYMNHECDYYKTQIDFLT